MNITITFDLTLLAIVGANLLGILLYFGLMKLRARRLDRARERIVASVSAYFARTGVSVRAEAISPPGTERFIVVADTEPLKRLRHSHIVEMVLIDEVKRATGLTVDRVFWRFPLAPREGASIEAPNAAGVAPRIAAIDPYLAQGLARLRTPEGVEVHEDSWGHFEEALHQRETRPQAADDGDAGPPA